MKIAFDFQVFVNQRFGGISRYFTRLAANLPACGAISPRIVAPLYINAYLADLPVSCVQGFEVAPSRWGRRLAQIVDSVLTGPLIWLDQPDIVHETYYSEKGYAPSRARVVLTVYDFIHERYAAEFGPEDTIAMRKAAAIARADHVICISENTRRDLVEYYPAAATKSSVTLLGFDAQPVVQHVAPTQPYLLFVGERWGYKNFAGLLEAYARAPNLIESFELIAVGGGAFSQHEHEMIARLGVAKKVRQVDADDLGLRGWYAGATVFIYPSLYEGFGIPPLEAMAAGVPVVAIRASSVPEVCGNAAAYAPPGDVEALGAVLESVALSPSAAAALVTAGAERLTHFSWLKCARETASVYRSLL